MLAASVVSACGPVKPARVGHSTTMTIRTLADALPGRNEPYSEIDRVTLKRTAGKSRIPITSTDGPTSSRSGPRR